MAKRDYVTEAEPSPVRPSVPVIAPRGQEMVPPFGVSDVSPVVSCTAEEDMARQEYKLQSDLQYQVTRFGAGLPFQSGVVDFDHMDLTKAFELIEESQQRWLTLPKVVRDRYQSWANVEAAAASGELEQVLKTAGIDGGVSPSKPDGSASDSAAGDQGDA